MRYYSLTGNWDVELADHSRYTMVIPGTLDENQIGERDHGSNQWHPDSDIGNAEGAFDPNAPIATRFTRKHTYEGPAYLSKTITLQPEEGKRYFAEVERARTLKLFVNGEKAENFVPPSVSTPHIFEITGMLTGEDTLQFVSDNSYPGLPHDAIVFSSAATDETQTNWNGLLGYVRIRREEDVFLSEVRVLPEDGTVTVKAVVSSKDGYSGILTIASEALEEEYRMEISVPAGESELAFEDLPLKTTVKKWDEFEGNLYNLTVGLSGKEEKTVSFGVRVFGDDGKGRLALNGRTVFIRSEANCAEFPETGYPPMTVEEWTEVLEMYKSYGINCMRFHSHCPAEEAFTAADAMGMMMQPELSHWNPRTAFEDEESWRYYPVELERVIRMLANHPSFVMLTFGNELWTHELGRTRMNEMMKLAHKTDSTRLYANASNGFYGTDGCDPESDFYTSQKYFEWDLRGTFAGMEEGVTGIQGYINNQYPNAKTNYDASMEELRKTYRKPVFSFEVGQFEVLPDFRELSQFHGISDPVNYVLIQEKAEKLGLSDVWSSYVEATGELARIGYREEIEAAMRTKEMSGISLLGLQDFPGQGTALVGMLNSHLKPKDYPFAQPERFRAFFRSELPLAELEKYTYEAGETLTARVQIANFGKEDLEAGLEYELRGSKTIQGKLRPVKAVQGEHTDAGTISVKLDGYEKAERLNLYLKFGTTENTYPVWVYPQTTPQCPVDVYETKVLDEKALQVLEKGGKVYLSPDAEKDQLPKSIGTQFTTDFWSVGTFAAQEGGMGQLIDVSHPIFKNFPTESYTNWQWWPMASTRAAILPKLYTSIITEMDSYAYMRPMTQLLECRCGNGSLMFSTMGLQNLQMYPEGRALLQAVYDYMGSEEFCPSQIIETEVFKELVKE